MILADLDKVPLFQDLDADALETISSFSEKQCLFDGEVLISENETEQIDMFVLCRGQIEIISSGTGITSDEISLSSPDKEIFGEIGWLRGGKRTATIRCVGETDVIKINGDKLSSYLESDPAVGFTVMKQIACLLANRLDKADILLKQILWNARI